MVVAKLIRKEALWTIYPEDRKGKDGEEGLGLVDCHIIPHYNSPHWETKRKGVIEKLKPMIDTPLYALDDDSALKVIDGDIEIIGEGETLVI